MRASVDSSCRLISKGNGMGQALNYTINFILNEINRLPTGTTNEDFIVDLREGAIRTVLNAAARQISSGATNKSLYTFELSANPFLKNGVI